MTTKSAIATALGLILVSAVLAVTVVTLSHRPIARLPDASVTAPTPLPPAPRNFLPDKPAAAPVPPPTLPPAAVISVSPATQPPQEPTAKSVAARSVPSQVDTEPVVPLPVAREALAYVGADPAASEVWYQAINDRNLTPHQRQDLIEDLNEDGFPDPKNLTPNDLPLIVNRLQIIEAAAPEAMDDVNAAAFAEAYKDLVNMYNRLTGT